MNIQLSGAEEWIDQEMTSVLGQVLIRWVHLFSPCLAGWLNDIVLLQLCICGGLFECCEGGRRGCEGCRADGWYGEAAGYKIGDGVSKADSNSRCNNVLWISGADQSKNGGDVKMEG